MAEIDALCLATRPTSLYTHTVSAWPALAGVFAARIGFRPALVAALAVAFTLTSLAPGTLLLSSLRVGAMIPAIVTLTAGSIAELVPAGRQQQFWGWTTLGFAVVQALAGYAFSTLYAVFGSYVTLFALGGALVLVAMAAACTLRTA